MKMKRKFMTHLLVFCSTYLCLETHAAEQAPPRIDQPTNKRMRVEAPPAPEKHPRRDDVRPAFLIPPPETKNPFQFPDTIRVILSFLPEQKDRQAFLSINRACYNVLSPLFISRNKMVGNSPWLGVNLSPRALYVFNKRMGAYLGYYNNIKMSHTMAEEVMHFRQSAIELIRNPFFPPNHLVSRYVYLLLQDIFVERFNSLPYDLRAQLQDLGDVEAAKNHLARGDFQTIFELAQPQLQNETALGFHFAQFVCGYQDHELNY